MQFDDSGSVSLVMTVMVATAVCLLFANSVTAPIHAWMVGNSNPFWYWGASFVHIDLNHLASNVTGLIMVHFLFGRFLVLPGWGLAFLVAAPIAHAIVVLSGRFAWVAGLSTSIHALVGFAALALLLDEHDQAPKPAGFLAGWRRNAVFGLLVCAGLLVKVFLDTIWVSYWAEAEAISGASMHAMAAALGAIGALLMAEPGRWRRPLQLRSVGMSPAGCHN